jgi:hypothetical protein
VLKSALKYVVKYVELQRETVLKCFKCLKLDGISVQGHSKSPLAEVMLGAAGPETEDLRW